MENIIKRLTIEKCISIGITKAKLVELYGLKCYDYAIPQSLFELLQTNTVLHKEYNLIFHFVYCYDRCSFGELYPLTQEGEMIMQELNMPIPDYNG